MTEYLTETSPEAFLDYPAKRDVPPGSKTCPKCLGHGGWNLRLNAYRLHQYEDTAENRHRYAHFRCSCSNCNGWGYVDETQTCVHEWGPRTSLGNCLHRYVCRKCNDSMVQDSG